MNAPGSIEFILHAFVYFFFINYRYGYRYGAVSSRCIALLGGIFRTVTSGRAKRLQLGILAPRWTPSMTVNRFRSRSGERGKNAIRRGLDARTNAHALPTERFPIGHANSDLRVSRWTGFRNKEANVMIDLSDLTMHTDYSQ